MEKTLDDTEKLMFKELHDKEVELCAKAIEKWGIDAQLDMVIEEAAELIQAVNKLKRAKGTDNEFDALKAFAGEISDVGILTDSMKRHFRLKEECFLIRKYKVARLKERLEKV